MNEEERALLRRIERFNSVTLRELVGQLFIEERGGRMPADVWLALGRELSALGSACQDRAERIEPQQIDAPSGEQPEIPPSEMDERPGDHRTY